MIEQVIIKNYKSIRDLKLTLNRLNVLIGSNGVGKSNFISFFELVKAIYEQRFGSYTLFRDGMDRLLYQGRKTSDNIEGLIDFNNLNAFFFELVPSQSDKGFINSAGDYFNGNEDANKNYKQWHYKICDVAVEESSLRDKEKKDTRLKYVGRYLRSFTVYHFHDTSSSSPMRLDSQIDDNYILRNNGSNLASYLYRIQEYDEKAFRLIEGVVRSIAPYFKRFDLHPKLNNPDKIELKWEEQDSDMYLNGHNFSDGTLRFIALATLLLQSETPEIIIIDEPELGLHPAAINKLAALIKRASKKSQIILSTQSTNLVNCFEVENIIVVDREDKQSVFKHLSTDDLSTWLNDYDYSISDLWEKNLIGGQL